MNTTLRCDFQPYMDLNGFPCPQPFTPGTNPFGSDNGNCFLSEYMIILLRNKDIFDQDRQDFLNKVNSCINQNTLNRVPAGQLDGQNGPDDYYAVMNACNQLGDTSIPRKLLWGMIKYFGCLNNVNPGKWTQDSFLFRQPQLVCAIVNAAFPSMKNPLHYLVRFLSFYFYTYSAISILVSCIGVNKEDTDPRRLGWHLVENVSKQSLMCYLARKIWMNRLFSDYPNGMGDVASIYYNPKPQNPYSKYWVTE